MVFHIQFFLFFSIQKDVRIKPLQIIKEARQYSLFQPEFIKNLHRNVRPLLQQRPSEAANGARRLACEIKNINSKRPETLAAASCRGRFGLFDSEDGFVNRLNSMTAGLTGHAVV